MPHDNRAIIADAPRAARRWPIALVVLAGALLLGTAAAVFYGQAGLTLSHYDARAHLVVARRITDSLTPGWKQIGAVWLPLPHLLNLPVVQVDWAYRTGYASAALSVAALAAGLAALSAHLFRVTRSAPAALVAPALILLNPNVLYLQSTPMTEPLLLGLSLLCVWLVSRDAGRLPGGFGPWAGVGLAALVLTRYEGWFVAAALVALVAAGRTAADLKRAGGLAVWVVSAIAAFLLLSKGATGVWFVSSGFFEPDLTTRHQVGMALTSVGRGAAELGGAVVLVSGGLGALIALVAAARGQTPTALPLALLAAGLLPLYAFYQGHPFRIRYMVAVVVALGALSALVIARLPRRLQAAGALVLVLVVSWQRPAFDRDAAMVREAQWETPYRLERRTVTAYLTREWDGTPILASMGSLGHYMQEASEAGFAIAHFVHEGNGDLWQAARARPAAYVAWVLIEERAEGGDELARRAQRDDSFLNGMDRVAEGGGVALYRRR